MTYGAETWTLRQEAVYRMKVLQRAIERVMLGMKLIDRDPNVLIRSRSKEKGIIELNYKMETADSNEGRPMKRNREEEEEEEELEDREELKWSTVEKKGKK
ncbi:uncharacterized protein LOC113226653 [Hyposmocoma kahamanoa]|uniref:uncharacterized protein LOC113226653 n=1 Tax=Hyposmocoma kahamanoa TaxID=1477025 RepID=UPI000E6D83A9|nr:uncharacterized protein LOC113226653 [Hyposmocoma kahamanoa]